MYVVAAYCIVTAVPFAYHQFLEPKLWAWPSAFVEAFPALHWIVLVINISTLAPGRSRTARLAAGAYVLGAAAVGMALTRYPYLATLEPGHAGFEYAAVALLLVCLLAVADLLSMREQGTRSLEPSPPVVRSFALAGALVGLGSSLMSLALSYSAGRAPIGVQAWVFGIAGSCLVQASLFAVCGGLIRMPSLVGGDRWRQSLRYLVIVALLSGLMYARVLRALTITGFTAEVLAVLVSVSVVSTFLATSRRIRQIRSIASIGNPVHRVRVPSALCLFAAGSAIPLSSLFVAKYDWDTTIQSVITATFWAAALFVSFSQTHRADRGPRFMLPFALASLVALRLLLTTPIAPAVELQLSAFSSADPSFNLLTRLLTAESTGEAAEFYSLLRRNTNIAHTAVTPLNIEFADNSKSDTKKKPHIFLFVVDSLRPDYLGPYNDAVTFTRAIDAFARESLVFKRAFSRYGATAMAVPSIWTGGMTVHMQYVQPYAPMNTLEKLITANGYTQFISLDPITVRLLAPGTKFTRLDASRTVADFRMCDTLHELETRLSVGSDEPVFAFTLPQDVHISVSLKTRAEPGRSYPGFVDRVASQVNRVDSCFGNFIDFLKRSGMYDDSIVVLTSDHGDSLGEHGQWGHAYTLYPEIIRVPLIIHIPKWIRRYADPDSVAFSADIVPTLYNLLGVTPSDLGSLYGTSLTGSGADSMRDRSQDAFLESSSYGPVYGVITKGGTQYYLADGVTGHDSAYDLADIAAPKTLAITSELRSRSWRAIAEDVARLRDLYHVGSS